MTIATAGFDHSRRVEPHRLVHTGRRWYLVARDQDRDDWRTFRVDRIDDPRSTGARFVPRDPSDAAVYVADAVTAAPYRQRARILVRAPAATVAERVSPGTGHRAPGSSKRPTLTAAGWPSAPTRSRRW